MQRLIAEAYEESSPDTPVYFLVTHSVNVQQELQQFYQKKAASQNVKLHNFQVGRGLDKKVEDALGKAITAGDWVLLENLHLAGDWLLELEQMVAELHDRLDKETANAKFRLFLSSIAMERCPDMILKQSVKVALQQPSGVRLKMERFIENFEADQTWRKGQNSTLHKNLYFALSYLHAVLDGRKAYGPLGWNVYGGFDASDFSISEAQIKSVIDKGIEDKDTMLHMIKYLFSNINFSGKISRAEDQRKLDAIIEDLIAPDLANCTTAAADPSRGHYGFPAPACSDMSAWVGKNLPVHDTAEIYGFNRNTERAMLGKRASDVLLRLYFLNRTQIIRTKLGYQDLEKNLETTSLKISLAKSSLHAQSTDIQILDRNVGAISRDASRAILPEDPSLPSLGGASGMQRVASHQYFNPEALELGNADSLLPLFVQI